MIVAAVKFYDLMRVEHSEHSARTLAELYLRRKCNDGLDREGAAIALADALAQRAATRIATAQAAIGRRKKKTPLNCWAGIVPDQPKPD